MAKKNKASAEAAEAEDKKGKAAETEETGKKGKKGKKNKEGKKKGKFKLLLKLFFILLLLALVAAFGISFYFNFEWLPVRTIILDFLAQIGPEGTRYTEILQQREDELYLKETELLQKETDLQTWEEDLNAFEARLDQLEENLNDRESVLYQEELSHTPIYRGDLSEEKLAELKNLGKIYSNMDAEAAAMILSQLYTASDMASILFYMDKPAAAGVLAALSPEISAQITSEMLRE